VIEQRPVQRVGDGIVGERKKDEGLAHVVVSSGEGTTMNGSAPRSKILLAPDTVTAAGS
jgi:hypothetical protein